jgi:hypothetical protein
MALAWRGKRKTAPKVYSGTFGTTSDLTLGRSDLTISQQIADLQSKVENVLAHIVTFQSGFPRITRKAPVYTRSHLVVFYEVLPALKHILTFSKRSVSIIGEIMGVASEGTEDLAKAHDHLKTIGTSADTAVSEIFSAIDEVGKHLKEAREKAGDEASASIDQANTQLMSIMNALQFHDITTDRGHKRATCEAWRSPCRVAFRVGRGGQGPSDQSQRRHVRRERFL